MDSLFLVFITLGMVVVSHGALSPELYWKSVLPNTPMPKSIRDDLENKNTKWVGTHKKHSFQHNLDSLNVDYVGREAYYIGKDSKDITDLQLRLANPNNINLYFFEHDIKDCNTTMTLDFSTKPSTRSAKFLPRREAENVPFSSEKLPEILRRFSVKPGSAEARTIENTLRNLEKSSRSTRGLVDFVATSLESMVDFVSSVIDGGGVEIGYSEVEMRGAKAEMETEMEIPIGKYTITSGTSQILSENDKVLICHKQKYPYTVFYCHGRPSTRAYMVPLEGTNGVVKVKAKALALCHVNTLDWDPNHFAFKMLKIERGTLPVCHFLPKDHIMWFKNN